MGGCVQSKQTQSQHSHKDGKDTKKSSIAEAVTEKGVSVHHLRTTFLKDVIEAGYTVSSNIYDLEDLGSKENGFIRKKGENMKDPYDGSKMGASYVDCLTGKDNVGQANVMLSYSWAYSIGDIVDTLADHCKTRKQDPKRTYVWICCLCINQHRVVEKKDAEIDDDKNFHDFHKTFYDRVTGVGEIISMMYPW